MKKINLLLMMFLLAALGCRSDHSLSESDSRKAMGSFSYRQVDKEKIPQVMNFLSAKTDHLRLPLKTKSAVHKGETIFGEIDTDNIIESITENNETYYVFAVIPDAEGGAEVYNLQVKVDNSAPQSAKVIVYYPTEDWVLNGNGDFSTFSGTAYTYSLNGEVESSVQYTLGAPGPCDPAPCPDCTPGGGTGSGGGSGGGGGPIGGGGPTSGGGMPTACIGCGPGETSGGGSGGGGSGGGGSGGGGAECGPWQTIYDSSGTAIGMTNGCDIVMYQNFYRLPSSCGGGNVVIAPQKTPCQKTKDMLTNPKTKPAIDNLKANSSSGNENGVKIKADGTPSDIIPGGPHSVNLGDKTGFQGGYHNHTPSGTPMFSPNDIEQLLGFALAQGNTGVTSNAFLGMVAPNGMHYVIRFNGGYNDALISFTDEEIKSYRRKYRKMKSDLVDPQLNGTTYINSDGSINNKGVEKLFFATINNMNLTGKVSLQRVENSGAVQSINVDSNNQPIAVPCS